MLTTSALPYLDDFNKKQGTKVVSVAAIHNEPMGLYAGKSDSLDKLERNSSKSKLNL